VDPRSGASPELWAALRRLAAGAPDLESLREHRIDVVAAAARRADGEAVPPELELAEQAALARALAADEVLAALHAAVSRPLLVMKGPAVAAWYPDPLLRPFYDLDVVVEDAPATRRELLEAGFAEVGDPRLYERIHHLRPLALGELPMPVEIHHEPKWPEGLAAPSPRELLRQAREGEGALAGLLVPEPGAHAVLCAAHSWAHNPLRRILDLADVAVLADTAGTETVLAVAARWRIERLVRTTLAACDALFAGRPLPVPLRLWAAHLPQARRRNVLEAHVERWLAAYWALPWPLAVRAMLQAAAHDASPLPGERISAKAVRVTRAIRDRFAPKEEHDADERLRGG
jgi:hypothetical protein